MEAKKLTDEQNAQIMQLRDEIVYHSRRLRELQAEMNGIASTVGTPMFNLTLTPVFAEASKSDKLKKEK